MNSAPAMQTDRQGNAVTNASHGAIAAIDHLAGQWLGYGNEMARFFESLQAYPECAQLNMMGAVLILSMEDGTANPQAAGMLAAAASQERSLNERETMMLAAMRAWSAGEIDRALAQHVAMAEKYPRDLFAMKTGQLHAFNLGDNEAILHLADLALADNRDNHFVHGMRAFGLEQCHRLDEAEEEARTAIAMDRNDPWAHHALAHVMETQGRLDEGVAWMSAMADTWENCKSFMYTHNWWHMALFLIDRDETAEALALYDKRVWGVWKEFSQDQINAVSLLARLEMRGVDVGERWKDVATYLKPRLHEHINPFLDLQYLYGLARAGERAAVAEMLASLEAHAEQAKPFARRAWQDAALPAAHALAAHAMGDWNGAVQGLSAALPHLQAIGGSHAQRDLFEQLHLDALMRAEWNARALAILEARDRARPNVPALKRGLAEINRRLGHGETAARYGAEAEQWRRRYRAA